MKVFISHSSYDKWVARQISKELNRTGHQTFLDEKDIRTGESIDQSIQEHLSDSDELLILLSPASLKSHWVFIELGGAKALGKKVVPFLFHVGSNEIPQPLSTLLCRDINDFDIYLGELDKSQFNQHVEPPRMSKEAGVKVKVIKSSLLTDEDKNEYPTWIDDMDKYSEREAKIVGDSGGCYLLDIDEGQHEWHPSWLIKYNE